MTIEDLRAALRAELGDETQGAYLWSDTLLDRFLSSAVGRLGADVPVQRSSTLSSDATGDYLLPADLLRLVGVQVNGQER